MREFLGAAYVIERKFDLAKDPVVDDREALRIERLRILRGSRRRSEDRARSLRAAAARAEENYRRARDLAHVS